MLDYIGRYTWGEEGKNEACHGPMTPSFMLPVVSWRWYVCRMEANCPVSGWELNVNSRPSCVLFCGSGVVKWMLPSLPKIHLSSERQEAYREQSNLLFSCFSVFWFQMTTPTSGLWAVRHSALWWTMMPARLSHDVKKRLLPLIQTPDSWCTDSFNKVYKKEDYQLFIAYIMSGSHILPLQAIMLSVR